jgi:hypothetical protein
LASTPSSNSVRALLGACSSVPQCGSTWLLDQNETESWEKLRLVGYGGIDAGRVDNSLANDVIVVGEDVLPEDRWHVYSFPLPKTYFETKGRRGLAVALAYDPPVRASRREYLARTMWIEVMRGISVAELEKFRTKHSGKGEPPQLPNRHLLNMRPTKEPLQWSTLQVRRIAWSKATTVDQDADGNVVLQIIVGCQHRFASGEDDQQKYALAVRVWHESPKVLLHAHVNARVRVRARVRARVQSSAGKKS